MIFDGCISLLAEFSRGDAPDTGEDSGEVVPVAKARSFGYFFDPKRGVMQEKAGLLDPFGRAVGLWAYPRLSLEQANKGIGIHPRDPG